MEFSGKIDLFLEFYINKVLNILKQLLNMSFNLTFLFFFIPKKITKDS